jgi:hypothetical protein
MEFAQMADTNILPMPRVRKVRKVSTTPRSVPSKRRLAQQHGAAAAVAVVAAVLLVLSLAHLASGIKLVTQCPLWEAWALALGIDIAFVAMEMASLAAATERVRREIGPWTKTGIVATLLLSAALNALAFAAQAVGWLVPAAALLGLFVPALVFALSRIAFALAASR